MRYSDRLSYDMTLTVFMNKLAKRFAVLTLATAILLFRLDFVWLVWIHFCFRMVKGNVRKQLLCAFPIQHRRLWILHAM